MKYKYNPDVKLPENVNISQDNLKGFYTFIYKRHMAWHNRFVLKLPREQWTDDPILIRSKYTNVYRELDRGTIWIFNQLSDYNTRILDYSFILDCVWKLCVYRLLNKVETFERIGLIGYKEFEDGKEDWFNHIHTLLDEGFKVWTSAHITLQSNLKQDRITNYKFILNRLYGDDFKALVYAVSGNIDQEEAFKLFKKCYGIGPFTAYELASDLGHFDWTKFNNNEWANAGPGCIPGIKLIFPNNTSQEDYLKSMILLRDNQEKAFNKYDLDFKSIRYDDKWLDLRNIEHSLCEFRKYWCEENKVGRIRPMFNPISDETLYDRLEISK